MHDAMIRLPAALPDRLREGCCKSGRIAGRTATEQLGRDLGQRWHSITARLGPPPQDAGGGARARCTSARTAFAASATDLQHFAVITPSLSTTMAHPAVWVVAEPGMLFP